MDGAGEVGRWDRSGRRGGLPSEPNAAEGAELRGRLSGHYPQAVRTLVYSCSLSPSSRSALLGEALRAALAEGGHGVDVTDLRSTVLPLCDGSADTGGDRVRRLAADAAEADAIALCVPIYNYGVNAAAKNLVEWIGRAWSEKPVGLMCAAGGQRSYMSAMGLSNSLALDFRCRVLPRFVYATWDDFDGDAPGDTLRPRIRELAEDLAAAAASMGH